MKWYYSDNLKLYVSMEPLKISSAVFKIAKELPINLEWDDYGNLVMLDFAEFKTIVRALDGVILSPAEYWQLYREALEADNRELLASLTSAEFTEILDRVYVADDTYIDHCEIVGAYQYEGTAIRFEPVAGRPGWITWEDIDVTTGHPVTVYAKNPDKPQMKYWSPDLANTEVKKTIAIRGFVTSVAMPSLDLGIPADTRQPKLMVRFCTRNEPEEFLTEEESGVVTTVMESGDIGQMEQFQETDTFAKISASGDASAGILRERFYSTLGRLRVCRGENRQDNRYKLLTFEGAEAYIKNNKKMLRTALEEEKMITFVAGHQNPDTDTVISSLFEAYRLHITAGDRGTVYLPLIQSDVMPREIRYILGEDICEALLYSAQLEIGGWLNSGRIRFVWTDQNYQKEYQKYVVAITDHHKLSDALQEGILEFPCEIEAVGSCTSLIAGKYIGQGLDFDAALSRIIYSAMLMDTENRVAHKMTEWDVRVMDFFREKAGVVSDDALYRDIMNRLIEETDGCRLYRRDYKHYRGFGFSVLKVKGMGEFTDFDRWMESVIDRAKADNEKYNDYFTLVKVVDYPEGGLSVNWERIYWVWNDTKIFSDSGTCNDNSFLADKVKELLVKIVTLCIPGGTIVLQENYIQISGTGKQVSRKKIVPAIKCLLKYCGQYTYIKSLEKWVALDFLKWNDSVSEYNRVPGAVGRKIESDAKGRICNISFIEAKRLMSYLGMEMLSLKEYWQVYKEAVERRDVALLESLTDSAFLEFTDTCCIRGKVVHNPALWEGEATEKNDTGSTSVSGPPEILYANPGLISPEYIDPDTGLPGRIFSAANYRDKNLWRYWSPMEDKTYIFSRTYIFLLQQPCLDAKVTPEESFVNMGIRPVRNRNLKVDVKIETVQSRLVMTYKSEYDKIYRVIYEEIL